MTVVRYILMAIVGLIVLAVVAIAAAIFVIDPNTYKPQIEQAVESRTNLDLTLTGDIGWSIFPLGLELNEVEATLDGERLVALQQLIAKVNFWSLVAMSPTVNMFVLDGLDARLTIDENGTGNWTRVLPEDEEAIKNPPQEEPSPEEAAAEKVSGEVLDFAVEEVSITNASIQFEDLSTGQSIVLQDFQVLASQIALGAEFPLEIGFLVNTEQPAMTVNGDITTRMSISEALDQFAVNGLDAQFELSGEPFSGNTVQAHITGSANANLENETIALEELQASLANLEITTNLTVEGYASQPTLSGELEVPEFSLRELLTTLGMDEIQTEDPEVLNRIALNTKLGGPAGTAELTELSIILDDTTFEGGARYNIGTGAIGLDLQGDSLNADRYLPPASEESEQQASAGNDSSGGSEQKAAEGAGGTGVETDLLPLETLRGLNLDINLGLNELIVSNLTITELNTEIDASNGQLQLTDLSGQLYEGAFQSTIGIDARTDDPAWDVRMQVSDVETQPLLTDLAEMDMLAGAANIEVDISTEGNRISDLRSNAGGEATFTLAEGEFTRMNLTRMACRGIALVNQEELTSDDWGTTTPFNDMSGTLTIDGDTLTNNNLVAALAGMRLEGEGTVDMATSEMDYEVGLRVVGEIHRDQACRVTEYVENVVIPVECRGNFSEDPASLCSFDGSRFRDTLKDIAANAARQKVREETEQVKEKAEQRAREEIEERLQGEDGEKVKDALRGLFDR